MGEGSVRSGGEVDARRDSEQQVTRWHLFWGIVTSIAIVAAVVVAVVFTVRARSACDEADVWFALYVPVGSEPAADARIRHADTCVGRVHSVYPGVRAVDLTYGPSSVPSAASVFRLPVSGRWESPGAAGSAPADSLGPLPRAEILVPAASPGTGQVGRIAVSVEMPETGRADTFRVTVREASRDTSALLAPGDSLPVGGGRLHVGGIQRYSVVVGTLDQGEYDGTVAEGTLPAGQTFDLLLGTGSTLEPKGGPLLGSGQRTDEYTLVVSHERPLVRTFQRVRGEEEAGRDVVAFELRSVGLANLVRDAERVAEFIASPQGRFRPPASRAEMAFESLTGSLANLDSTLADVSEEFAAGRGALLRLALDDAARTDFEALLASIATSLDSMEAALSSRPASPPLARLALSSKLEANLDRVAKNLSRLTTELSNEDRTVLARLTSEPVATRVEELLLEVTELAVRGQETLAVAEDVMQDLQSGLAGAAVGAGIVGGILSIAALIAALAG